MSRLPSVARHDSNIELFTQLLSGGMEMQNSRDSRIKVKFDRGKVWYQSADSEVKETGILLTTGDVFGSK